MTAQEMNVATVLLAGELPIGTGIDAFQCAKLPVEV